MATQDAIESALPTELHAIAGWMQSKDKVLPKIFDYKGGWELWAQTEINYYFEEVDPPTRQKYRGVFRELYMYADEKQKIDFYLHARDPKTDPHVGIELKCAGTFQFHKEGTFKKTIEKEVLKVVKGVRPEYRAPESPKGVKMFTVGLTSNADDLKNYAVNVQQYGPVRYATITNAGGMKFLLIWHEWYFA